jgi:Pycsar effector protein
MVKGVMKADQDQATAQSARDKSSGELPVPPGIGRQALPTPSASGGTSADKQQPAQPDSDMLRGDAEAREKFAQMVHEYVREYIKFADQKATFVFTGATALLAFLYKNDISARWLKPVMEWNILDALAFISMSALALGAVLAILVVVPRTSGSRRGFLFWEAIAEYETGRQYSDELRSLSPATLFQVTAEHCFDLARVCRAKHSMLRAAIWTAAVGLVASLSVFLFL